MIVTKRFLFYKTPHLYGARHVKHCKKAEALLSCRGNTTINNTNSNPLQVQKQICLNKIAQPYPSVYNATDVEHGWYDWWKMSGFFESSEATECKEVFSMILPPPNITGTLHLGHALTVTIQDVLVRWHRMKGFDVVWVPGSDHAGIATQVVVEKYLQNQDKKFTRQGMGREQFIEWAWKWKLEKGNIIFEQLEKLGASLDWKRNSFTLSDSHATAVNKAFETLYKKGLIYRGNFLVNWSCKLGSAISDIEVNYITVEKETRIVVPGYDKSIEFGIMYNFAYTLADGSGEIIVSTTRPETMLGDVAVAVNPQDIRYSKFIGKKLIHPFRNEFDENYLMPILADEYVNPQLGTGAVKITPGHDQNDFELGLRHNLPILNILSEEGNIQLCSGETTAWNEIANKLNHVPRFQARTDILKYLQSLNLFRGQQRHSMQIPICSRSGDVVEPLLKPQWFLRTSQMAADALNACKNGELKIEPEYYDKVWHNWLKCNQDWCLSRQLWWGHRIPIWRCSSTEGEHDFICAVSEEEAWSIAKKHPLAVKSQESLTLTQEDDVLDTWFSSALLPFANFGWPNNTVAGEKYYPLSLMETGHDILFFWVARMVMLGQALTGRLPFTNVMLHGVVCDGQGRKMSKSLGNVVDPLSVINGRSLSELEQDLKETGGTLMTEKELQRSLKALKVTFPNGIPKCGTDALRFSLVHNDPKSQQLNIDVQFVNTCASFCNKIWQAARFFILSHERGKGTYTDDISNHHVSDEKTLDWITSTYGVLDIEDKWILSRCGVTVKNMNSYLESRDFHLASRCLRTFLYTNMCDVYVEAAKPVLNDATNAEFHIKYNVMKICLITALKLLHPIMPFITEEIYQRIRVTTALSESSELHESIMTLNYPREEEWEAFISNNIMTDMEVVLEFVTCIRNSKSLYSLKWDDKPDILIIDRISSADVCFDNKNIIQEYSSLISKLSSCGKVEILQEYIDPETQSDYLLQVQKWSCTELPKYNSSVYVNVSEYLDINKELQKLTNQRTKTLKEFDNLKKKLEKRKQTISEVEKQKFTDKFERLSKMENVLNRNIK